MYINIYSYTLLQVYYRIQYYIGYRIYSMHNNEKHDFE